MANAMLVGKLRIRQLRVRSEACHQQSDSVLHNPQCPSSRNRASHDTAVLRERGSYHYSTAEDSNAAPYQGQFGLYDGDGYLWSFPAGYARYDYDSVLTLLF